MTMIIMKVCSADNMDIVANGSLLIRTLTTDLHLQLRDIATLDKLIDALRVMRQELEPWSTHA